MTVRDLVLRRLSEVIGRFPEVERGVGALGRRASRALAAWREPDPTERPATAERDETPAGGVRPGVPGTVEPFLTLYPPGHFYSPVPDLADVAQRAGALFEPDPDLRGIDLRSDGQVALFRTLAELARTSPLPVRPGTPDGRYGTDNPNYGVGDASMLHAMLRHLRPGRYLEVGSGYTTALALDVNDRFLGGAMSVAAIEPHTDLLRSVTRPGDPIDVLAEPVQDVPVDRFRVLEENDVLFLDCSHVLKTGSDVQFLYGRVLPALREGVYVHVHDVFWPFEYLRHWVEQGRAWNEAYLLRAFLCFNDAFEIVLWNHYLAVEHRDVVAAELPAMLATPGGAIWLRRTSRASRTSRTSRTSRASRTSRTSSPTGSAPRARGGWPTGSRP